MTLAATKESLPTALSHCRGSFCLFIPERPTTATKGEIVVVFCQTPAHALVSSSFLPEVTFQSARIE
jgi:hypothetical protein